MKKEECKCTWAIPGGVLAGLGIGFILLEKSPLFFIGSILVGLGLGLIMTAILAKKK